jgi:hypothetical protein
MPARFRNLMAFGTSALLVCPVYADSKPRPFHHIQAQAAVDYLNQAKSPAEFVKEMSMVLPPQESKGVQAIFKEFPIGEMAGPMPLFKAGGGKIEWKKDSLEVRADGSIVYRGVTFKFNTGTGLDRNLKRFMDDHRTKSRAQWLEFLPAAHADGGLTILAFGVLAVLALGGGAYLIWGTGKQVTSVECEGDNFKINGKIRTPIQVDEYLQRRMNADNDNTLLYKFSDVLLNQQPKCTPAATHNLIGYAQTRGKNTFHELTDEPATK